MFFVQCVASVTVVCCGVKQLVSSVLDIPLQLALLLQLAAAQPDGVAGQAGIVAPVGLTQSEARRFGYTHDRWLDVMRLHGGAAGYERFAARIFRTRSGLVYVPVARERLVIAAQQNDPAAVLSLTREAATANAMWLGRELGRAATADELYLAHIAAREEALALVRAGNSDAGQSASQLAPQAALAHPHLFFSGTRARTVGEVQKLVVQELVKAERLADLRARRAALDNWATTTTRWATGSTAMTMNR